jgi:hypothetical protein
MAPRSHRRARTRAGVVSAAIAFALVIAAAVLLGPSRGAGAAEPARLVLEAAEVKPSSAPPDTLCHLRARIRNAGQTTASAFAFRLELDDHEVGVYRDHLFMDPIEPGQTASLELFSFWTNETGRPLPASGTLRVELTLASARWMKQSRDADGTRVWNDAGAVEGLPQTASAAVKIVEPGARR